MSSSKKIIVFDASPIASGSKSGIGYYTFGLIETLSRQFPDHQFVGHYYNFILRSAQFDLPTAPNISYVRTSIVPGKVINLLRRIGLEIPIEILVLKRADFIIYPSYISKPSIYKTPCTTMIHDLAYLDMPETLNEKNLSDLVRFVPKSIERSSFITTISQATRKNISKRYPDYKKGIVVTHIPPVLMKLNDDNNKQDLRDIGIEGEYILFLGNVEPRKNIQRLIEAYSGLSKDLQSKYSLVIAGGKGWKDENIQLSLKEARGLGVNILTPGYVTDEQRVILYDRAALFAFVSLYEGFGMPLLEAMSLGTPVLTSNIPVLKEVAGNAAQYCDPESIESIRSGIDKILTRDELRKDLISKGLKKVKEYSWEKCTRELSGKIKEFTKD